MVKSTFICDICKKKSTEPINQANNDRSFCSINVSVSGSYHWNSNKLHACPDCLKKIGIQPHKPASPGQVVEDLFVEMLQQIGVQFEE